jgi:hypothetical protein
MRGRDGEIHHATVDASSLFAAADAALRPWALLWWYDREARVTVKLGDQAWTVTQERLRDWREKISEEAEVIEVPRPRFLAPATRGNSSFRQELRSLPLRTQRHRAAFPDPA